MSMTVKKLISELEKVDNKYLEVEFLNTEGRYAFLELDHIYKCSEKKKVIIYAKDKRQI